MPTTHCVRVDESREHARARTTRARGRAHDTADIPRAGDRDIVRESLAPHFDLEVVAEVDTRRAWSRLLTTTSAEVAIVGLADGESPDEFAPLLRVHPDLTVLAITLDGHTAFHCTMRMVVGAITEVSLQQLLNALRAWEGVHRTR